MTIAHIFNGELGFDVRTKLNDVIDIANAAGAGGGMAIGGAITSGTSGSVLFVDGSANLAQNNANFYWDDTNKYLKLGSSGTQAVVYLNTLPAIFEIPNASGNNWFENNAGNYTLTGYLNFGTGDNCLASLTSGVRNTGYGNSALFSCNTGFDNFGIGLQAGSSITSGDGNVAVGTFAMQLGQTISNNVALGLNALRQLGSAGGSPVGNVGIGSTALNQLRTGNASVAVGYNAAASVHDGRDNVAVGNYALGQAGGTNDFNTIVGGGAGFNVTNATASTILGCWYGPSASISNIIAITDGSLPTNPQLDYNYTTAGVWTFAFKIAVPGAANPVLTTTAAITSGAGAGAGTLTNAPSAGDPTKWIPINDNGTTRYIPAW